MTAAGTSRSYGVATLSTIGLNMVVGGGFFLMPSEFFAHVGAWSTLLVLVVGLCLASVALCFAEVGSRFTGSGGPYTYARVAFGPTTGFLIGWVLWLSRVVSHAAVLVALTVSLAAIVPGANEPLPRFLIVAGVTGALAWTNIRGARTGARVLFAISVIKFTPIVLLIVFGLNQVEAADFVGPSVVSLSDIAGAALLITFALSGFEMLTLPAGEAREPGRTVPRALMIALGLAVILIALANLVCVAMLGDVAATDTPVAASAVALAGAGAGLAVSIALIFTALGHNASSLIAASHVLYSAGERGDLPPLFARQHAAYRTPVVAILVTAACIVGLAVSGSFAVLAAIGGATRLMIYASVAAATLRLRRGSAEPVDEAAFRAPLGAAVPLFALVLCVLLATGLSVANATTAVIAVGTGLLLFLSQRAVSRSAAHIHSNNS